MDLYTRKIVGFYISARMTKELVIKVLHRTLNSKKQQNKSFIIRIMGANMR